MLTVVISFSFKQHPIAIGFYRLFDPNYTGERELTRIRADLLIHIKSLRTLNINFCQKSILNDAEVLRNLRRINYNDFVWVLGCSKPTIIVLKLQKKQ